MRRKEGTPEETKTAVYDTKGDSSFSGEVARFDYGAFEQTIDQFHPPITEPQPARSSHEPVQRRKTIDEQTIPKDDAVYEVRPLGTYSIVTIRGQINESFPGRTLASQLHGPTLFDLTEVDRVTSFGVRAWLEMLDGARLPFACFVRASPAIVNQITMMRNFCGTARIHSLVAPYACPRCGCGFGVPFEAVEDRTILRSRKPPKVVCPECRGPAEMDEDPWIYFDLDDHLLESIDPELQQVLVHMGDGPRRPPVEKSISGDLTRVRINGSVTGASRLQRAFEGLEGKCVLDLRTVTDIDDGGVENLIQRLSKLPDEVIRIVIEGAPLPLVHRLIGLRPDRVYVNSVITSVRSLNRSLKRRLCIDLRRNRIALKEQRVPDLDLPWHGDPMELEGQELLAGALWLLPDDGTFSSRLSAPPPPPRSTGVSAVSAVSAVLPAQSMTQTRAVARRIPWLFVFSFASILFVTVFLLTLALTMLVSQRWNSSDPSTATLSVPESGWSTGDSLPPPWAEVELAEAGGSILVVGQASAATPEGALTAARIHAADRLLDVFAREMKRSFPDEALPAEGNGREEALARWRIASASLALNRVKDAARKTEAGSYEVVAQYSVARTDIDALAARYNRESSFRGLTLAPRAPWVEPGVRLVKRESYIRNVEPGDMLKSIASTPVSTLEEFESIAESSYRALEEGDTLPFVFDRGGQGVLATIVKPKTQKAPDPAQTNRPTLFKKE